MWVFKFVIPVIHTMSASQPLRMIFSEIIRCLVLKFNTVLWYCVCGYWK